MRAWENVGKAVGNYSCREGFRDQLCAAVESGGEPASLHLQSVPLVYIQSNLQSCAQG